MNYKATILAVDNDRATQTIVKDFLEEEGYRVVTSKHGAELTKALRNSQPHLVLIDIVLPDKDGLILIPQIKDTHPIPVIVISDKDSTTDKIVGLEIGADDYLGKPFELRELSARIKANLRLVDMVEETTLDENTKVEEADVIKFGNWCLDRKKLQLLDETNKNIGLTMGEFELLEALVMSPNQVLSRERLFDLTRNGDLTAFDRAIDIQIGRIRKKLGDGPEKQQYIKTVRGVGYMLVAETTIQA